ncbi:MAG: hypothetical protein IRY98_13045, partial [Alicyclobacillaceae bacterium]|nr:hypothetical protein [Alicyclobacillaceae bacterium]
MVKRNMRWIACVLAWLLVMAATPLGALADSWSLTANLPTSASAALTTNSNMIDLAVTFNNVVDIKCLVKPAGSQAIRTYENPQIQGNQATFSGVLLSPGINEITFIGTSGSLQVQSPTYYVEYLNNPRIMNVRLQGVNIDNDSVAAVGVAASQNNPNAVTTVSWQYDTENATQSTVNGTNVIGVPVGTKQTWTTSLKLTPGEMPVTTVASNSQRSVAVQKSVILLDPANQSAVYNVELQYPNNNPTPLWQGQNVQVAVSQTQGQSWTLAGKIATPQSTSTPPTIQVTLDGNTYQVTATQGSSQVKWIKQWGSEDKLAVWTWSVPNLSLTTGDHTISLQ